MHKNSFDTEANKMQPIKNGREKFIYNKCVILINLTQTNIKTS